MDDSSDEIIFSKGLLQSKYLVVIIGMDKAHYLHFTAAFDKSTRCWSVQGSWNSAIQRTWRSSHWQPSIQGREHT